MRWSNVPHLDRDHEGPIPRVNVSLKLSALYSQFRPIDPVGTAAAVKQRLRPLLRSARKHDAYVHVDMEQYSYKDLTLDIFKDILMEDEFRDFPDVGIVLQAYLPETERDAADLLEWAKKRGTPIWVRLVKGAYWDYETVVCKAHDWPIPVYQQKWESDANFERLTRFLMENYRWLRPALGSHNLRSLSYGIACAHQLGVPELCLRTADALRHGSRAGAAFRRPGPSRADLHAVWRVDSRHGLPGPAAAGKHVERFVSCGRASPNTLRLRSC